MLEHWRESFPESFENEYRLSCRSSFALLVIVVDKTNGDWYIYLKSST